MNEISKLLPIVADNQKHLGMKCDITNREEIRNVVKEVEKTLGPIDTLINCAGSLFIFVQL
jgi:NAD(P)-dependent dehydrogenase (short-subunit alcohol dehydrogenase family)